MLLIGIRDTTLATQEIHFLQNHAVAGVILFKRNIISREQVTALTAEIRASVARPLLIAVDQEGGRVQRLSEGYTKLPSLHWLAKKYQHDPKEGIALLQQHAWIMANEVRSSGIDLSFTPVVDLAGTNAAILDRAFSNDPHMTANLACAYIQAMHAANMPATLKHFPGHGSVLEDTHLESAIDPRPWSSILQNDLYPFIEGIRAKADAVMMSHVIYSQLAAEPAGFSRFWIEDVLRKQLGFRGVVFSDDIAMRAAHQYNTVTARVHAHLDAGCDVVLACAPDDVEEAVQAMHNRSCSTTRLLGLIGQRGIAWDTLLADSRYQTTQHNLLQSYSNAVS